MNQSVVRKWILVCWLCLALLGGSAFLSACSLSSSSLSSVDTGSATPVPGSSSRYPYSLVVTQGSCSAWQVVMPVDLQQHPLCAESVPEMHPGDYVQLSYGVLTQIFRIVSVDRVRQVVRLVEM